MTALHEGDVVAARSHLQRGLAAVPVEMHHSRAIAEFGGDPDVSCLAYLGRALWSLGYPDQALARAREAVRLAQERGGAFDGTVAQAAEGFGTVDLRDASLLLQELAASRP